MQLKTRPIQFFYPNPDLGFKKLDPNFKIRFMFKVGCLESWPHDYFYLEMITLVSVGCGATSSTWLSAGGIPPQVLGSAHVQTNPPHDPNYRPIYRLPYRRMVVILAISVNARPRITTNAHKVTQRCTHLVQGATLMDLTMCGRLWLFFLARQANPEMNLLWGSLAVKLT